MEWGYTKTGKGRTETSDEKEVKGSNHRRISAEGCAIYTQEWPFMIIFPRVCVVINMKWQKRIFQVLKSTTACVIRDPEPQHNPYHGLA